MRMLRGMGSIRSRYVIGCQDMSPDPIPIPFFHMTHFMFQALTTITLTCAFFLKSDVEYRLTKITAIFSMAPAAVININLFTLTFRYNATIKKNTSAANIHILENPQAVSNKMAA